jgi:hypothetical protein
MPVRDSATTTDRTGEPLRWHRSLCVIQRIIRGTLISLLVAVSLLVAWRRLRGGLTVPLDSVRLAATGLAAAAIIGIAARGAPVGVQTIAPLASQTASAAIAPLAALLLLLAVWLPDSPLWGLTIGWTAALAAYVLCRPLKNTDRSGRVSTPARECPRWDHEQQSNHAALRAAALKPACPPEETSQMPLKPSRPIGVAPATISQSLTRWRAGPQRETVRAQLSAPLEPGARVATLHVAFCPPFRESPETHAEQVDGPEAELRLVQVLPYGARIDLRLRRPAGEPAEVTVRLDATGPV